MADLVLVEADGSRRLPVKVPGPNEPVVPKNSDMVLCVLGLSSWAARGQAVFSRGAGGGDCAGARTA